VYAGMELSERQAGDICYTNVARLPSTHCKEHLLPSYCSDYPSSRPDQRHKSSVVLSIFVSSKVARRTLAAQHSTLMRRSGHHHCDCVCLGTSGTCQRSSFTTRAIEQRCRAAKALLGWHRWDASCGDLNPDKDQRGRIASK